MGAFSAALWWYVCTNGRRDFSPLICGAKEMVVVVPAESHIEDKVWRVTRVMRWDWKAKGVAVFKTKLKA